jgi:hypothetical protein
MYAKSAVMFTIPMQVIPITVLQKELLLRIFLKIGLVPCAVSEKTTLPPRHEQQQVNTVFKKGGNIGVSSCFYFRNTGTKDFFMKQKHILPAEYHGRRYYSLDSYLKNVFHEKLYKLSLDGGMTCPNRDGTLSYGGCIFCSEGGSGDFAAVRTTDIRRQLDEAKAAVSRKFSGQHYIAYFQSFTNTYAPVTYLEKLFGPVMEQDDISVLSIATRPDCLEPEKLKLLQKLNRIKPVWVELGLQTIHEKTAELINRRYPLSCFDKAVHELKNIGVGVIVHTILGLPHESREQMMQTADYVGRSGADGIKLQLLHVLQNTALAEMYDKGVFDTLSVHEYISIVTDIIALLPPQIVIHRLTGDGNKEILISPRWSGDKRRILNAISHELKAQDIVQGCRFVP